MYLNVVKFISTYVFVYNVTYLCSVFTYHSWKSFFFYIISVYWHSYSKYDVLSIGEIRSDIYIIKA
jgi:hypothetical protein